MATSDDRVSPLTFGQLSVWRDVQDLPPDRAHEANVANVWTVDREAPVRRILMALDELARRHESLRVRYEDGPHGLRMILPCGIDRAPVRVVQEDAEHTTQSVLDRELSAAVDLGAGPGWRATVVTGRASTAVLVVNHHITADAWASNLMRNDFQSFLAGSKPEPACSPGLLDWAQEQRAANEQGTRRRGRALAHFERVVTADEALAVVHKDDQSRTVQAKLLSRELRIAAAQLASVAKTSIGAVVLAAAVRAFARHLGVARLAVDVMASNRTSGRSRLLVTSMNQWVPALLERLPGYPLTEAAVKLQHTMVDAYRHGEYDVDELRRLRRDTLGSVAQASALAVNYVPDPPRSVPQPEDRLEQIVSIRPFATLYAQPCYIKINDLDPDLCIWVTSRLAGDAGTAISIMTSLRDDLMSAATAP